MLVAKQFPWRGHSLLFLQLQFLDVELVTDLARIWLLWQDIVLLTSGMQLYLTFTLLRLKLLCHRLVFAKCFSSSLREFCAILFFTNLLYGGLNQIMFHWRFRFVDGVLVGISLVYSKET